MTARPGAQDADRGLRRQLRSHHQGARGRHAPQPRVRRPAGRGGRDQLGEAAVVQRRRADGADSRTAPDESRIEVRSFTGLLVDFAAEAGAKLIIRGLRAVSDFEYEFQMALMNRHLSGRLETVFMVPSLDTTYISSSIVREVARFGGDLSGLVHPVVAEALRAEIPDGRVTVGAWWCVARIRARAARNRKRVAFPETADPRTLDAVRGMVAGGIVNPVLILDPDHPESHAAVREHGGVAGAERDRGGRAGALVTAMELVRSGGADACVAGAAHTTAAVLRAALKIVGKAPGVRPRFQRLLHDRARPGSGSGTEVLTFTDCAVVPEPTAEPTGGHRDRGGAGPDAGRRRRAAGCVSLVQHPGQRRRGVAVGRAGAGGGGADARTGARGRCGRGIAG